MRALASDLGAFPCYVQLAVHNGFNDISFVRKHVPLLSQNNIKVLSTGELSELSEACVFGQDRIFR